MAKDGLYDIPAGCICRGDGLYGMRCDAPAHAQLRQHTYIEHKTYTGPGCAMCGRPEDAPVHTHKRASDE